MSCESGAPGPAAAALLEALYSEGLGEFAYTNALAALPRPAFAPAPGGEAPRGRVAPGPGAAPDISKGAGDADTPAAPPPRRVLVPVGGGKDSAVAIEIVRRSGVRGGAVLDRRRAADRAHGRRSPGSRT